MKADINCDMGESFGLYSFGKDEALMPLITQANVACGFHGSDPTHMRETVELAAENGVGIGAHFSLPDLQGFGRREMAMEREELANIIVYQIGALKGFLDLVGVPLNHLKPHGALYGMAVRQQHVAEAIADAAEIHGVPLLGLAGTLHEEVFSRRGIPFQSEFFADLDYDDDGKLIITRKHDAVDPELAGERARRAVLDGKLVSIGGKELPVRAETICIHSDTPNARDVAEAVRAALQ